MQDHLILDGLRRGDPRALALLAEHYREKLIVHADRTLRHRSDSEDVVQEVLLKASEAEAWAGIESLPGWLYAVTYRHAVDRLRARGRSIRILGTLPAPRVVPAADAAATDEKERLLAALHRLDEPYRTALALRYLEGLEFREIAARMQALERTTRTWVGRGINRLRETMAEGCQP